MHCSDPWTEERLDRLAVALYPVIIGRPLSKPVPNAARLPKQWGPKPTGQPEQP
jgi:hypothetical protein